MPDTTRRNPEYWAIVKFNYSATERATLILNARFYEMNPHYLEGEINE